MKRVPCHRAMVVVAALLFLLCVTTRTQALKPTVPRTERRYTVHVQPLTTGLDDDGLESTLVSLTMTTSLWLPKGSAEDREEHLSFNEELDPFWVHVLRRRRFDLIEWSGCGGSWRPEWTSTLHNRKHPVDKSTAELIHDLSHHSVCSQSTLSACGWVSTSSNGNNDGNATSAGEEDLRHHHQWLAQFVSSLLSSPLTWWDDTPRFVRPIGALHSVPAGNSVFASSGYSGKFGDVRWCSYHHAQQDTLCTQHVTALLNGGRSGKDVEERIPRGIFRAGLVSMEDFFSSVFHHFRFEVKQSPTTEGGEARGNHTNEEAEIKLVMRMAFVEQNKKFDALSSHWKESFPEYAPSVDFITGSQLNAKLSSALQTLKKIQGARSGNDNQALGNVEVTPTAQHFISAVGYDRGTYRLVVNPTPEVPTSGNSNTKSRHEQSLMLQPGDTLEALLFFPLHLMRPSLHEMRAGAGLESRVENAFVDESANVLVVLVHTTVTETAMRPLEAGVQSNGFVLCEFPFRFGWSANKDMPPDANSNRILPQPVIRVGRHVCSAGGKVGEGDKASGAQNCGMSRCASISNKRIDHQGSLESLMESMRRDNNRKGPCVCYFWLRCSNVAGSTLPVPDPAMVFNVVTLGLIFSAIVAGGVVRSTKRLFDVEESGADDENPLIIRIILRIMKRLRKRRAAAAGTG
ncbi:glycosylphosphatidylinositol (GPI) anchor, putative [Trypanosoma brucei brucei TREU927]|uniref:Glycosylphosphatidylinositol (GPI) anchor, putative n=1 Tax=Trypanosoma brucei brucei (strain 927/4 GUTat10.1) TaxID=185431 RepID=Q583K1_TRYB2|nr:glycosylphosphatidylinositol (GPI) anchor, putative [Trypanosoma brucei brucei TREU927]AAX79749.1 glycosylphosphatidylinositol (GPI) anchor, putative [Trypanosoma brucei]AAZ10783.1 glycosylphosphatidylinositol (GPI) anchor, putative [Trypanosoma brucei brucei TREU927]